MVLSNVQPWTAFAPIRLRLSPDASAAVQAGFNFNNGVLLTPRDDALIEAGTKGLELTNAQKRRIASANALLRFDYLAEALGDLGPGSRPSRPISKQESAETGLIDCVVALWLSQPCEPAFESTFQVSGGNTSELTRRNTNRYLPIQSLTLDYDAGEHTREHLLLARGLIDGYSKTADGSSVATAWRLLFRALTDLHWDTRCLTLWNGLEALLGSDQEITYRLSLRAALLLGKDREHARQLFDCAKRLYRWRSVTIHGRTSGTKDAAANLLATQALLRTVLFTIAGNSELCNAFDSEPKRSSYLDSLPFVRLAES